MNSKKWRCFHCDSVFRNREYAAEHFGVGEGATPACKLSHSEGHLVTYIRKLENELASFRNESSDLERAWFSKEAECADAVRKAEESGYNKGVQGGIEEAKRMFEKDFTERLATFTAAETIAALEDGYRRNEGGVFPDWIYEARRNRRVEEGVPWLTELLAALEWGNGTIHQALSAIRRLVAVEKEREEKQKAACDHRWMEHINGWEKCALCGKLS